jgi:hypothetical protein
MGEKRESGDRFYYVNPCVGRLYRYVPKVFEFKVQRLLYVRK